MKTLFAAFVLIIAIAAFPAAATVEPGKEGSLAEFVRPVPGERVCFARRYDAAHLARHPKQTVTAIEFRLAYFRHEPDAHNGKGQRNYYYQLSVRFRSRPGKTYRASGDCRPGKGAISCTVECDGGGVRVRWQKRPEQILIDYGDGGGIRLAACGGEEEREDENVKALKPGADDRSFLLTRMNGSECPDYETW